tara:strand:+ start:900 stop:1304 length:405 start_codon:yes stop_codon:yes gene_type:complete
MSYKYFAGDIVLSGSDTLSIPEKSDASLDLDGGYQLTVNGTRGILTLTTHGTTATGAPFGSSASGLVELVNTEIDTDSMVIITSLSSSAATKGYGITAYPRLTVDNNHGFVMVNSSGGTIASDTTIKLQYVIIK